MGIPAVIAGAHLKCIVNGHMLGVITGVSWDVDTGDTPRYQIDDNVAAEIVPGRYSVGGTFSLVRGRFSGGLEGLGVQAFAERVLRQKYSTIELVDRVTDEVVHRFEDCVVAKQHWQTDAKGLLMGSFSWLGRRSVTEAAR
jgi:hypothetical protein